MCKHDKVALKVGLDGKQRYTEGICYKCRQPVKRANRQTKWTILG